MRLCRRKSRGYDPEDPFAPVPATADSLGGGPKEQCGEDRDVQEVLVL